MIYGKSIELMYQIICLIELRFYIPLDTKYVILETFSPTVSWHSTKETKHTKSKQHKNKVVSAKREKKHKIHKN